MNAGYIVQGEHIREPEKMKLLRGCRALVVNCGIDLGQLAAAADPGTTFLQSFNAQMISSAGVGNVMMDKLRADMAPYRLLDPRGNPVVDSEYGDVLFDYQNMDGARAYAEWIATNCLLGTYLDDLTEAIEQHRVDDMPDRNVALSWPFWRDTFVRELRRLAPFKIIVGNTAGKIFGALNGICIEKGHVDKMTPVVALGKYVGQWNRGRKPILNLDWSMFFDLWPLGILRGVEMTPGDLI